jgi:hypothetical protein
VARIHHATLALGLLVALGAACDRSRAPEPEVVPPASPPANPSGAPSVAAPAASLSTKLRRAAPDRVVAIGDVHGDLDTFERALRLAGAIDARGHWNGGTLVLVQTGDEIDRGNDDRAVLDLVEGLKKEAAAAGGEVIALLGNHEIMNASADFRYVTPRGFASFSPAGASSLPAADTAAPTRGRMQAFAPGGTYASMLAGRPLVAEVGDTVFVHGGVLPKHVAYGLDRMNDELDAWLTGKRQTPPSIVVADDGPVWTRAYSGEDAAPDCSALTKTLARLGAARMVVGHTVQKEGMNAACDGKVWRIDVGLSHVYGGPVEALEIRGGHATVLREEAGAPKP